MVFAVKVAMERVVAYGHSNVKATHRTTFEITKESWLTPRGDCIIGVNASKSPREFNSELKDLLMKDSTLVIVVLLTENSYDYALGYGSSKLTLTDDTRSIFRKSNFTSPNTVAILMNKAAKDLRRDLIEDLKKGSRLDVIILALNPYIT